MADVQSTPVGCPVVATSPYSQASTELELSMQVQAGSLVLSATDASNHLGCRHLTQLDWAAAHGRLAAPHGRDLDRAALEIRGLEHETAYVEHLSGRGLSVYRLAKSDEPDDAVRAQLLAAMRTGHDVIVQAPLAEGGWRGRADILLRVPIASDLGAHSYEVVDTKLARETRGGAILQLCVYSELVGRLQGRRPDHMHIVVPGEAFVPRTYRIDEFESYFRFLRRRLDEAIETTPATYPEPVPQCDICRWWLACDKRRRDDDHLSLVAGISSSQRREVATWGIDTLRALAELPLPITHKPRRGAREGYERVREQARVQLVGRTRNCPVFERLPVHPGDGLCRLPEPHPDDLFFDVEGDIFVADGGLEYLLGLAHRAPDGAFAYTGRWALDRESERAAFTAFMTDVLARWDRAPGMHIYHFTAYDPAALKRLVGRFGEHGTDLDRMLRGGLFVDLHAVVRQSLRASVEEYSIKQLEVFYAFERDAKLEIVRPHRRALEFALESGAGATGITDEMRDVVGRYNRDDCVSAAGLRDWLERLRDEAIASGEDIPRPEPQSAKASEEIEERDRRAAALMARLMVDIPSQDADRTPEQRASWLLAWLVEYHRREEKVAFWEKFRLLDLRDEELLDDRKALGGLVFECEAGTEKRSVLYRYRFPPQFTDFKPGDDLLAMDGTAAGTVHAIDRVAGTIDIKRSGKMETSHPENVITFTHRGTKDLTQSLDCLGNWVADHGIDAPAPEHRAARDLLLRLAPRFATGAAGLKATSDSDITARACRLASELDHGVLAVQGPPGAGKTYNGAQMIRALVAQGKRVGVTAVSHKVIRNLLDQVAETTIAGEPVRCGHKGGDPDSGASKVQSLKNNKSARAALDEGTIQVLGGTQFLWASGDFTDSIDVLFVDEAGQMSLANVLAEAQASQSIVLLGDPQQLEQPQKGSHPEGADVSALEHLVYVDGRKTIADDRGLFLAETWRLHPEICRYTSTIFYEGRLQSRRGLEHQALRGPTRFQGSGLWFEPVVHEGNRSASSEEVERVVEIVRELLQDGVEWIDAGERARQMTLDDILVVAPYNTQVAELTAALPQNARVGTVDRFQGQQAPVVIYSLASSTAEDAPRGMEFLYNGNRLNVATSRARCAAILVANPRLFGPDCRTPEQMRLANAFCAYLDHVEAAERRA